MPVRHALFAKRGLPPLDQALQHLALKRSQGAERRAA
jgi:hypothetical protein